MISKITTLLNQGGVIAYPTEAVYGLGCDPMNKAAVLKLLKLKNRATSKGLILVAANIDAVKPFIKEIPKEKMDAVRASWPGPTSWVFPASENTPKWICGDFNSVAIRVSAHPVVKKICEDFAGPIVSTSANKEGKTPAKSFAEVKAMFNDEVDLIVEDAVGQEHKPSKIIDALTGQIIRD